MTERVKGRLHQRTRTWYGVPVDITASSDHWHRVVVPGLVLPHPGLVNLFARWGLPVDERLALTCRHEFGHLQTLPVPLAHLLLIIFWPRRGRRGGSRWRRALVGFVAHQAVWELAAESYVVANASNRRRSRSGTGRAIYVTLWSGIAFLAVAATVFLMQREAS